MRVVAVQVTACLGAVARVAVGERWQLGRRREEGGGTRRPRAEVATAAEGEG